MQQFKSLIASLIAIFSFNYSIQSQTTLNVEWNHFLDNCEYRTPVQYSQTMLGMRTGATLSYQFDTTSTLVGGGSGLYEYGSRAKHIEPYLTAYYQYKDKHYRLNMGLFPRKGLLNYPLALLTDTLEYYRPNIEGALFQIQFQNFKQNVWCDWTSRQTLHDRENFLFGSSGALNMGPIFIHDYFVMLHNAGAIIEPPNDHIQDNGGAFIRAGLNLKEWIPIDSLTLSGGCLQFMNRIRSVTDFHLNRGAVIELSALYKKFGINTLYFKGKGERIVFGDKFFQADEYAHVAVYWLPISFKGVSSRIELDFEFTKGHIDSAQKFYICANIDKLLK